jgi:cytochrome c oxidase subunit 3/cytochrome o ubiquinol oxidase subunit 3
MSEGARLMNATSTTLPPPELEWKLPPRGQVGMYALIAAETAIFSIFVVAYLFYVGKSLSGPTPSEVLSPPILYSVCLLSSSLTIHFAGKNLRGGNVRSFAAWWFLTIVLGATFLYGTASEWHRLIYKEGLTITTNLLGTTYYSLVGLHGFHVIVGLLALTTVMVFTVSGAVKQAHAERIDVLSLYWHFVDAVWVVVFTVVYVVGR